MRRRWLSLIGMAAVLLAGCDRGEPPTAGGPPQLRRLSEAQYRHAVGDVFGRDIQIAGRFEPELRANGLLALGAGEATITPAGFEQYDAMARSVAAQVVDVKHRDALPCRPPVPAKRDDACADRIFGRYARLLLRRPVAAEEVAELTAAAGRAGDSLGDFHAGIAAALASLLSKPEFLFRVESVDAAGRLDAFSLAQRLSFFLWDSAPDEALLAAAEQGGLATPDGRAREVARLMASPRLEAGVRAFFADFLALDGFAGLAKDPLIYPAFSRKIADDAREETLRFVVDQVLTRQGDYRDLLTVRRSFLNADLGQVYAVPVAKRDWQAFEFHPEEERAGLLTQLGFLALHAHSGRSSATLRGKAVRELLLCQPVPAPPNNVNFSIVQDISNGEFRTARDRLTAHRSDATCAGCHKIVDPIGLALENFDGLGQYRDVENGAVIDPSGELDGTRFRNAAELGRALHENPALTACVAESLWKYAVGRPAQAGEAAWMTWLNRHFAADGYRISALMRRIATSDAFSKVEETR